MFQKTNIEEKLRRVRDRRASGASLLKEVHEILKENEVKRNEIRDTLGGTNDDEPNHFNVDHLERENIFHLKDIQQICVTYRLRFLDSHFFKGDIPEEAISEIRHLEKVHDTSLKNFKIMAPAKLMKLENADDPLLFAPMGNDYYYLIYKWGNDLHPMRKWLMWPYKNFENLVFTVFVLSLLITALTPMQAFTKGTPTNAEYLMLFLFMFKAIGGIVIYYGFAKGKNFNEAIWDSKYYNA